MAKIAQCLRGRYEKYVLAGNARDLLKDQVDLDVRVAL